MKKIVLVLLVVISTLTVIGASTAHAYDPTRTVCETTGGTSATSSDLCNQNAGGDPFFGQGGLLSEIIDIFSVVIGIVSVIMIMLGGFEYVTSGGDSQKVNKAKDTLLFAIIGIAVTAIAQLIVLFVINNLGT